MPMRRLLVALASFFVAVPAWACPVCGRGAPESEGAYLTMSGILSALPLLMVGGILFWVARRLRAHDAAQRREDPAE